MHKHVEIFTSSFKPYYNWITFNTNYDIRDNNVFRVLNLIITGLPSILINTLQKDIEETF